MAQSNPTAAELAFADAVADEVNRLLKLRRAEVPVGEADKRWRAGKPKAVPHEEDGYDDP